MTDTQRSNPDFCGIVLAGGLGTRLYPCTAAVCKQILPVYDKPMIYYPLSTLMMAGIRDILVITTREDLPLFQKVLGDGSRFGVSISYAIQDQPRGIAHAFVVAEHFIASRPVCLILGDNIFYGPMDFVRKAMTDHSGATIFAYRVSEPERYGVVTLDSQGMPTRIEEKPLAPESPYAIPGLYFFDPDVSAFARRLAPGKRGELEITDVQRIYLEGGRLRVVTPGRGVAWLDMGTPESLLNAATFIHAIEQRQGMKIACLEEVALRMGYLSVQEYADVVDALPESSYKSYCKHVHTDWIASH